MYFKVNPQKVFLSRDGFYCTWNFSVFWVCWDRLRMTSCVKRRRKPQNPCQFRGSRQLIGSKNISHLPGATAQTQTIKNLKLISVGCDMSIQLFSLPDSFHLIVVIRWCHTRKYLHFAARWRGLILVAGRCEFAFQIYRKHDDLNYDEKWCLVMIVQWCHIASKLRLWAAMKW